MIRIDARDLIDRSVVLLCGLKKKMVRVSSRSSVVAAISLFVLALGATAGSLTPSAAPAATMHTLTNIWDTIASTTYDSSAITSNQNGSLLGNLKYIENQLGWASGSSNIWNLNSGNVGIGTTTPSAKLSVSGTASISGALTLAGSLTNSVLSYSGASLSFTNLPTSAGGASGSFEFRVGNGTSIGQGITGRQYKGLYIATSGNVGIGTNSPDENLVVYDRLVANQRAAIKVTGDPAAGARFNAEVVVQRGAGVRDVAGISLGYAGQAAGVSDFFLGMQYQGGSVDRNFYISRSGYTSLNNGTPFITIAYASGKIGVNNVLPATAFDIKGSSTFDPFSVASVSGDSFLYINKSGNIGIRKAAPTTTLDISGSASVSSNLDITGTASASKLFVGLTGTQATFALCHPTNGQTTSQELVDCSPSADADYMEMYPVDTGIQEGDIVMPDPSRTVISTQNDRIPVLIKATSRSQALGIVSIASKASDFNSVGHNILPADNPLPIALSGRVKVRISMEHGPISVGDPIMLSSTAGVGAKATTAGFIVGTALDSASSDGSVLVFVNSTYWAPEVPASDAPSEPDSLFATILRWFRDRLGITFGEGWMRADVLCAGDECVNADQLRRLLELVEGGAAPEPAAIPSPDPDVTAGDDVSPTPEVDASPAVAEIIEPTPEPTLLEDTPPTL